GGTGITISSNQINVNSSQSGITSLGTLTSLTSSGVVNFTNTTDSSSTTTGSVQLSGGLAVSKNIYCASNITVPTSPTANNHAANKLYVDNKFLNPSLNTLVVSNSGSTT